MIVSIKLTVTWSRQNLICGKVIPNMGMEMTARKWFIFALDFDQIHHSEDLHLLYKKNLQVILWTIWGWISQFQVVWRMNCTYFPPIVHAHFFAKRANIWAKFSGNDWERLKMWTGDIALHKNIFETSNHLSTLVKAIIVSNSLRTIICRCETATAYVVFDFRIIWLNKRHKIMIANYCYLLKCTCTAW